MVTDTQFYHGFEKKWIIVNGIPYEGTMVKAFAGESHQPR